MNNWDKHAKKACFEGGAPAGWREVPWRQGGASKRSSSEEARVRLSPLD